MKLRGRGWGKWQLRWLKRTSLGHLRLIDVYRFLDIVVTIPPPSRDFCTGHSPRGLARCKSVTERAQKSGISIGMSTLILRVMLTTKTKRLACNTYFGGSRQVPAKCSVMSFGGFGSAILTFKIYGTADREGGSRAGDPDLDSSVPICPLSVGFGNFLILRFPQEFSQEFFWLFLFLNL